MREIDLLRIFCVFFGVIAFMAILGLMAHSPDSHAYQTLAMAVDKYCGRK